MSPLGAFSTSNFKLRHYPHGCRGLDLIGGDVSEVPPPLDPSSMTALSAAHLFFDILYLTAEATARRKGLI